METVYKYGPIGYGEFTDIEMPHGAELLHFNIQDDRLWVWAKVETMNPAVTRRLKIVGTGQVTPEYGMHVGTAFEGIFVWHLFDLGEM